MEAPAEDQSRGSKDFSSEERATIIAMAKEVGFAKVAREFGIKARLISYWVQQEKKSSRSSGSSKPTAAKSKGTISREKEAEHMEDTPTVAAEAVKAVEPAVRMSERTVSVKELGSAKLPERSERKQAQTDERALTDEQSLIVENAILKERVSALKAEIEKLRAALTSLM